MPHKTICFVNSVRSWGGGEKWHYETALFLKEKGFHVIFICAPGSELSRKLKNTDIIIAEINIGNLSFLNPFTKSKIQNVLKQHQVETVVLNLSSDLKSAGIAAKNAGVKNIVYRRGSAIPIKNSFFNRFLFKNVITHVIANSIATKNTILQNNAGLFDGERISVIYNGIPIPNIYLSPVRDDIGRNLSRDGVSAEVILCNIGRLSFEKNQKFLIDVALRLKENNVKFKLWLVGTGKDEEALKKYTSELQLEDCVEFKGFINDVMKVLEQCDIFLLSSLWEGFGYVLAEAGLAGKPVVAFNVASIPEIVQHERTGLLSEVNNQAAFYNNVLQLIQHPELRKTIGENASLYIRETFGEHKIKQQLFDYFIHL